MASPCVHARVFSLLLFGRSTQVGDVPHPDGGQKRDATVNHPVILHEARLRTIPEIERESNGNAWKNRVSERRKPNSALSKQCLDLRPMNPAANINQIVRQDDRKL